MSEPLSGGRYVRKAKTEAFVRTAEATSAVPIPTITETPAEAKADDTPSTATGRKAK